MGKLVEIATGKTWEIPAGKMQAALDSKLYKTIGGETTSIITGGGYAADVPVDELDGHIAGEGREETFDESAKRTDDARKEREHGGIGGKVSTVLKSAASAATFGGYSYAANLLLGDEYAERTREQREVNSGLAMGGDIAGMVLPALVTGGGSLASKALAATPAGRVASLGASLSKRSKVLGYGVEGALSGAGQAAHELAVSENPYDLENAASTIPTGLALGGLIGGGVGVFAKAAGAGLRKSREVLEGMAQKADDAKSVADDLAELDLGQLRDARRVEQSAVGSTLADDAAGYHALTQEVDPMLIAQGEHKTILVKVKRARRSLLDDPKSLAERPSGLLKPLRREEKVLAEMLEQSDETLAKLAREDEILLGKLKQTESGVLKNKAARKFSDWKGKNINAAKAAEGVEVTADEMVEFKAALAGSEIRGARAKTIEGLEGLLEKNRASQASIESLLDGTTPRLREISAAEDVLKMPAKPRGMAEQAAQGMVFSSATALASPLGPLAPLIGAAVSKKLMGLTFGRLGKSVAEAGRRTASAVDKLLSATAKTGKVAPPLATKALTMTSYGPETATKATVGRNVSKMVTTYKAREAEIYSQVEAGPSGIRMRPAARREVGKRLAGVRAISPMMADKIETTVARKVAFLATKLPKKPDFLARTIGPDSWRPTDFQIRTFARFMAAVEDPGAVEERLADGTLSPEDGEAYRTVYPEKFAQLQRTIMERAPELRASLSYNKRLSLSIFTGIAVEPSLDPRIFAVLQSQFNDEPGTEGGTTAPKAQAQFASVKNQEQATPGQERSA